MNHYWVRNASGGVRVSWQGVAFRRQAIGIVMIAGVRQLNGDLRVNLTLIPGDKRRRDIDNVLKALLDAMTHARAWSDDSQIKSLHVELLDPEKGAARAILEVTALARRRATPNPEGSISHVAQLA